jgi:hypothetical protein
MRDSIQVKCQINFMRDSILAKLTLNLTFRQYMIFFITILIKYSATV